MTTLCNHIFHLVYNLNSSEIQGEAGLRDVRNGPGTGLKTPLLGYKGECCATFARGEAAA
jgi:hypothetical protein